MPKKGQFKLTGPAGARADREFTDYSTPSFAETDGAERIIVQYVPHHLSIVFRRTKMLDHVDDRLARLQ